jgi:hypothetical protein
MVAILFFFFSIRLTTRVKLGHSKRNERQHCENSADRHRCSFFVCCVLPLCHECVVRSMVHASHHNDVVDVVGIGIDDRIRIACAHFGNNITC